MPPHTKEMVTNVMVVKEQLAQVVTLRRPVLPL